MKVRVRKKDRRVIAPNVVPSVVEEEGYKPRALDLVRQGFGDYVPGRTAEELVAQEPGGVEFLAEYEETRKRHRARKDKFAKSIMGLQASTGTVLLDEFAPEADDDAEYAFG